MMVVTMMGAVAVKSKSNYKPNCTQDKYKSIGKNGQNDKKYQECSDGSREGYRLMFAMGCI